MNARRGLAVMALAIAASALTHSAGAEPSAAPAPTTGTPLGVRPQKALDLAQEPPSTGLGWKLAAVVLVGAGAAWAWRKRGAAVSLTETPSLRILRRTTIGVRSELLVVDIDGQRMLLGVTPSSIQNLYISPLPEGEADHEASPAAPEVDDEPLPTRETRRLPTARPAARKALRSVQNSPEPVEEQARGLYAIAERK